MSATLIAAVVFGIIAILGGGALIVGLSEPLAGIKDLFIALFELICNNAIWFILCLLVFVIAISVIRKMKFAPAEIGMSKQQKIDNKFRQSKFNAEEEQRRIDNKYRQDRFNAEKEQRRLDNEFRNNQRGGRNRW